MSETTFADVTREQPEWRWLNEHGQPMTNWLSTRAPPEHMRQISDYRGTMRVQFRSEVEDVKPT